jgi:hypothetical protein
MRQGQDFYCPGTIKQGYGQGKLGRKGKLKSQIKRTPPEGRVKAAKQKCVYVVFIVGGKTSY